MSVNDPREMTASELVGERDRLQSALGEAERIIADLRARLSVVASEYEKRTRKAPEPRLSDHALLRYLERVFDLDLALIRAEIMTPAVVDAVRSGASAVTVNGVKFVCDKGTIVTVLDETQRLKNGTKRGKIIELTATDDDDPADYISPRRPMREALARIVTHSNGG